MPCDWNDHTAKSRLRCRSTSAQGVAPTSGVPPCARHPLRRRSPCCRRPCRRYSPAASDRGFRCPLYAQRLANGSKCCPPRNGNWRHVYAIHFIATAATWAKIVPGVPALLVESPTPSRSRASNRPCRLGRSRHPGNRSARSTRHLRRAHVLWDQRCRDPRLCPRREPSRPCRQSG